MVVVDDTKLLGNTIAWVSCFIGFGDGAYLVHFGYGNTFPELHHEPAPKMCSYALKVDIISMTMDKPQSFNHYQHSSHGQLSCVDERTLQLCHHDRFAYHLVK